MILSERFNLCGFLYFCLVKLKCFIVLVIIFCFPIAMSSCVKMQSHIENSGEDGRGEKSYTVAKGGSFVVLRGRVCPLHPFFQNISLPENCDEFGEIELSKANFTVMGKEILQGNDSDYEFALFTGDYWTMKKMKDKYLQNVDYVAVFDVSSLNMISNTSQSSSGSDIAFAAQLVGLGVVGLVGETLNSMESSNSSQKWCMVIRCRVYIAESGKVVFDKKFEVYDNTAEISSKILGVEGNRKDQLKVDSMVHEGVRLAVSDIDKCKSSFR